MSRTAVINVVGLTERLIGPNTPNISAFARKGSLTRIGPDGMLATLQNTQVHAPVPNE